MNAHSRARLSRARLLAILVPNALLWGAIGFQYLDHLVPCELCMDQRWPLIGAIVLALIAIALRTASGASRAATALSALALLASGAIGLYQAGAEYHWWQGPQACTAPKLSGGDILAQVLAAPVVRCDVPQWTLFHVSLAGWNALICCIFGVSILWLTRKPAR